MKKILIIGRPNVGKSSLFNRLCGRRIAVISDFAGTTRDVNYNQIELYGREFLLVDSGGLDETNELFSAVKKRTLAEASEADILLFLVDGKLMPDEEDRRLFYSLLRLNKPTALVVNKIDGKRDKERSFEFANFGAKQFFAISVSHNSGIDELSEWLCSLEAPTPSEPQEDFESFLDNFDEEGELQQARDESNSNLTLVREAPLDETDENGVNESRVEEILTQFANRAIRIGIIGRVNVGKSSLLNALVSANRSVVSSVEGTTIDPVEESVSACGREFAFVDTAGIRKRGKIEGIERFALLRTQNILERSDIALLVLDASEELTELDERIAGLASKFELGVIIVLNKWDKVLANSLAAKDFSALLTKNTTLTPELKAALTPSKEDASLLFDKKVKEIKDRFKFLAFAPVISVSATEKKRVAKIFTLAQKVYENYTQRLKTAKVNEVLQEAIKTHPIPSQKGRRVRVYYASQFGFAPPKIALVMNKSELHFSYKRYLANKFREAFELEGSPILFFERKRGERAEGAKVQGSETAQKAGDEQ